MEATTACLAVAVLVLRHLRELRRAARLEHEARRLRSPPADASP